MDPAIGAPTVVGGSRAAFFDVDRTLIRVNTGNLFIRWRYRKGEVGWRDVLRVSRWMAQYTLGIVDTSVVTARALTMVAGMRETTLTEQCAAWYVDEVRQHVSDKAREEVRRRQQQGYTCALLTASTPYIIGPLAEDLGIEHVLCTHLEVAEGKFTGRYHEPLCYGAGKVARAQRWAQQHDIDLQRSAFFTDSVSDSPMLEQVGEPRVINPDPRLKLRAWRRGWPVERWQ